MGKAAFGEPLTATELALFREVAARDPPSQRVSELGIVAGRGDERGNVGADGCDEV